MQNLIRKILFRCLTAYCLLHTFCSYAQDEVDIVDPYQMKVSRSAQADTFYFTQNKIANPQSKAKLDTLRSYDVFLEERMTPFGIAYICNGNEVTKKKYLEYKQFWNASGACKPCLLYTYDDKDQLKYEAYQYQDCLCGSYKEYYKDGTLKVEGQFKNVATDNWEKLSSRDVCNLRNGIWIYYFDNGVTEKTETYIDGKLKDSFTPTVNITSVKKTTNTQNADDEDEETTQKKGLFKRLKDKNQSQEDK